MSAMTTTGRSLPDVSIVFVTYNSSAVIAAALASVPAGYHVLVVDNASEDETVAICRERGAEVFRLDRNIGYGAAANAAIARTDRAFVLLLNPDIVLDRQCVDRLHAAAERHDSVGLFGPMQYRREGGVTVDHDKPSSLLVPTERTGLVLSETVQEVDFLLGSAYFIRRRAFEDIGGFDEEIFLFYEDDDLCRRLRDAGWARALVSDAACEHAVGESTPPTDQLIHAKNWHIAWSECYARRKHAMAERRYGPALVNRFKLLLHGVTGNGKKRAKAAGALHGRRDFFRGIRAQDRPIVGGRLQGR